MREIHNHTMDSTRWHDFRFRDGDIVTVTWAKAGTTWVQQIVGQLIFAGEPLVPIHEISPWVEHRCFSKRRMQAVLELQRHRRFMKSHLPADALVLSRQARYIYVARDGRDTLWSWYQHHCQLTPQVYAILNGAPGRSGPPLEPPMRAVREYFHEWLDRDGFPLWPFWSHVQSWWNVRDRENVLLVHFNDLKDDLAGQIGRVARFLQIDLDARLLERIERHCSFEYMRSNATSLARNLEQSFAGGAGAFVHKGTNGRWRDVLTAADIDKYERLANEHLTADCAHWLAAGGVRHTRHDRSQGEGN